MWVHCWLQTSVWLLCQRPGPGARTGRWLPGAGHRPLPWRTSCTPADVTLQRWYWEPSAWNHWDWAYNKSGCEHLHLNWSLFIVTEFWFIKLFIDYLITNLRHLNMIDSLVNIKGTPLRSGRVTSLKGHCLIFLSAIYQLFIKYFNIK